MTDYPLLPPNLSVESSLEWDLLGAQITPGQTTSGVLPVVRTDGGGLWVAELDLRLFDFDQLRSMRALRALTSGGTIPIIVPRKDVLQPWPTINGVVVSSYGNTSFDDGAFFSDDSGFSQPVISASVAADAALRATQLTITPLAMAPLRGGEAFSICHATKGWRMYEIGTVSVDDDGNSVVTFLPTLREAVTADTAVEFDSPRCLMRPPDPTALNHKMDAPWFSTQTLKFVEAFG